MTPMGRYEQSANTSEQSYFAIVLVMARGKAGPVSRSCLGSRATAR